jgi:hypothetical protein
VEVEFETTGGVSHQLLRPPSESDKTTQELFNYLRTLTRSYSTQPRTVTMGLDVDPKKFGFGTDYLNAMRALAVSLRQDPAFYPYLWRSSDRCKSMIPAPRKFVQEKWYELPLNKATNAELVLYIPHLPGNGETVRLKCFTVPEDPESQTHTRSVLYYLDQT